MDYIQNLTCELVFPLWVDNKCAKNKWKFEKLLGIMTSERHRLITTATGDPIINERDGILVQKLSDKYLGIKFRNFLIIPSNFFGRRTANNFHRNGVIQKERLKKNIRVLKTTIILVVMIARNGNSLLKSMVSWAKKNRDTTIKYL